MKFTLLTLVSSALCCLFPTIVVGQIAVDDDLLQLNVYAVNASESALEDMLKDADDYMNIFFESEPGYTELEPGDEVPFGDRKFRALAGSHTEKSGGELKATAPMIRGSSTKRILPLRMCPTTCARLGSATCKTLGCAYCGATCRKRMRQLILSDDKVKNIEKSLKDKLSAVCKGRPGCSIYAKIMELQSVNGTIVAVPLVA